MRGCHLINNTENRTMYISKKAAKKLAVAWQSFTEAVGRADHNSIVIYAGMLRRAQEKTGVEFLTTQALENHIAASNREVARES